MYSQAIDAEVNAELVPALDALTRAMIGLNYTPVAAFDACWHVAIEGTLAGAETIEPSDEAFLEAAFVDALEPVPFDDLSRWGDGFDDEPADAVLMLPPIAGGDGFEPTPEDLDWLRAQEEAREPSHRVWWAQSQEWVDDHASPVVGMMD